MANHWKNLDSDKLAGAIQDGPDLDNELVEELETDLWAIVEKAHRKPGNTAPEIIFSLTHTLASISFQYRCPNTTTQELVSIHEKGLRVILEYLEAEEDEDRPVKRRGTWGVMA